MASKKGFKKYSFELEGEIEKKFIYFLKTNIYNARLMNICKEHTLVHNGTISTTRFSNKNDCCCSKILIFDKDELEDKKIKSIISAAKKYNYYEIISKPCIEVVFVAFFREVNVEKSIKEIYSILSKEAMKVKLSYNTNNKMNDFSKLMKWAEEKIKNDSTFLSTWENRLKNMKEKNISNFYDFILILKEHQDE